MRWGGRAPKVRFAPKATVSDRAAKCRNGPTSDIGKSLARPYHAAFKDRHFVVRRVLTVIGEKLNGAAVSLPARTNWLHRVFRDVFTNLEAHLRTYAG
jgi:hypothetical protein